MKNSTTSERLKEIMKEKNLRSIDLVNLCQPFCKQYNIKMGRNDISQYLSGKVIPSQKKLSILALALNVNEVYLMGYDTFFDKNDNSKSDESRDVALFTSIMDLGKSEVDRELLYKCSRLNQKNKKKITKEVNQILKRQNDYFEKDEIDDTWFDPYELEFKGSDWTPSTLDAMAVRYKLLFDKLKDLPEENHQFIIDLTDSIMKEIDEQLDKGN